MKQTKNKKKRQDKKYLQLCRKNNIKQTKLSVSEVLEMEIEIKEKLKSEMYQKLQKKYPTTSFKDIVYKPADWIKGD